MKVQVKLTIQSDKVITYNSEVAEGLIFNNREFKRIYDVEDSSKSTSEILIQSRKQHSDEIHELYLKIRELCYEELGEYPSIEIEWSIIY